MSERDFSIPKEYRRTVSRAEIFAERLNEYRRAFPAGPINTWAEVVEGQRARVKSLRSIGRLKRQLSEFRDSAPDLSGSLQGIQHEVARLTMADDDIGLGEERWDYDSKISQFRRVKKYEDSRANGFPDFEGLLKESDRLSSNNRLFINTEDRQIVIGDKLVTFDQQRDWDVFMYLVRRRNQNISPRDLKIAASEAGYWESNPSTASVKRLRLLVETEPQEPRIINVVGERRNAIYRFEVGQIRFYYPSQEVVVDNVVSSAKYNPVDMDEFRRRNESTRRREIESRDPELLGRIRGIIQEVNSISEVSIGKPVTLFQISRAFPSIKNRFMAEMQEKYITPDTREGDKHPGFKKHEVVFMVYFRRFGERLNLDPILVKELIGFIRDEVVLADNTKLG